MSAASAPRNGLGWAILAAALAVPGFLFYNWWSHLKAERHRAISQKARGRVPEGGVFATPAPSAMKLVNPVSAAAPASAGAATAPSVPSALPAAAPAASAPVAAASAAAPEPVPTQAPASPPAEASAGPETAAVPAPDAAAPPPPLPRDPMISPMDIVRMQQAELERQLAAEALRREQEGARPAPKRVVPVETLVDLQGIVATAGGENKAIINDAVVGVGETVDAGGRSVRVVKISAAGVTFQYRNRRFVKNVSKD